MSSIFRTGCFLFLRDPHGGVEDLDRMQAAGFSGVFCNIGDHPPSEWEAIIRPRALQRGMVCGPWLRTVAEGNAFSTAKLDELLACADRWSSPVIVNSESELQGTGQELTTLIADRCRGYDAALSMEPIPFDNVAWWPIGNAGMPVLPQMFAPLGFGGDPSSIRDLWQAYGVPCVFATFGTYGGVTPADYVLRHPYSLYTGDDCGGNYAAWSPKLYGYVGCAEEPEPEPTPPPDGGDGAMTVIGDQDGVDATMNRLRDLDPAGTVMVKDAKGKWPPLSSIDSVPLDKQKAYDKLQRALTILVEDHDEQAPREGGHVTYLRHLLADLTQLAGSLLALALVALAVVACVYGTVWLVQELL